MSPCPLDRVMATAATAITNKPHYSIKLDPREIVWRDCVERLCEEIVWRATLKHGDHWSPRVALCWWGLSPRGPVLVGARPAWPCAGGGSARVALCWWGISPCGPVLAGAQSLCWRGLSPCAGGGSVLCWRGLSPRGPMLAGAQSLCWRGISPCGPVMAGAKSLSESASFRVTQL